MLLSHFVFSHPLFLSLLISNLSAYFCLSTIILPFPLLLYQLFTSTSFYHFISLSNSSLSPYNLFPRTASLLHVPLSSSYYSSLPCTIYFHFLLLSYLHFSLFFISSLAFSSSCLFHVTSSRSSKVLFPEGRIMQLHRFNQYERSSFCEFNLYHITSRSYYSHAHALTHMYTYMHTQTDG